MSLTPSRPTSRFFNRADELRRLGEWWARPGATMGLVWGRRRVGKTALLQAFARGKPTVFHAAAGRPVADELRLLSAAAAPVLSDRVRDFTVSPFRDWDEALTNLASAASERPVLVVLDEFPELVRVTPELPGILRAHWDRIRTSSRLRILLCGSAVRTMRAIQEERAPLYGRMDLTLLVHPFRPHEAAEMLPRLAPAEMALVWGIVGGVPLYLSWWDDGADLKANLLRLVCTPGAPLLTEGQLVLATEAASGDLDGPILRAIAMGRTKHNEIADTVRAEPARTLDRLIELRLVERVVPVTDDPRRTRRRIYRIADNFLTFWLGVLDRYRAEIERGLGRTILTPLANALDDHMGWIWEETFRIHLRRLAAEGAIAADAVAVGSWWREMGEDQLDAVVLAGRERAAVLVGEAKWARSVDAGRLERSLLAKAANLAQKREPLRLAVCAREEVRRASRDTLVVTAEDIFRT